MTNRPRHRVQQGRRSTGTQPLVMNARQFEIHIRLYYRVGQEIVLKVLHRSDVEVMRTGGRVPLFFFFSPPWAEQ